MSEFQVRKSNLGESRIVDAGSKDPVIGDNQIMVRVEKFGFSANNITYGVAGDTLGYWQFFPPLDNDTQDWGIIPVWGFAEITASGIEALPIGERIFGYFPPADHLIMEPVDVANDSFFDGSEHRSQLPKGYNLYRRVSAEPGYDRAGDDLRMLLYPLYLTGFALWDLLKENDWYGAKQIVIVSASSKTSIGLGYAIDGDDEAPASIGLTSSGNQSFVADLSLYANTVAYDTLEQEVEMRPTAIVDMAGNADVLGRLHAHLGDNMVKTLNVGLTHWEQQGRDDRINRDRSEFFFAPAQIQKRLKEWGPEAFQARSGKFVQGACMKSLSWLNLKQLNGLEELEQRFGAVLDGSAPPQDGLVIKL